MALRVAVVGGGWAGLAAAVYATLAGHQVTLFEATRQFGGRARSLAIALRDGGTAQVDNGQHILIGAYRESLALMEEVGVRPDEVLLRMPLTLRFPDHTGIAFPDIGAPFDAFAGILAARGWTLRDRLSLAAAATRWAFGGFSAPASATVDEVCRAVSPRVMRELIAPLCVSALNTPAGEASGAVFLRVIRDALFGAGHGRWGGSNLLIPRVDLGRVFPDAAQAWLHAAGAKMLQGRRVQHLAQDHIVDGEDFDRVVLACHPWEAARLLAGSGLEAGGWLTEANALRHEAIATIYAMGPRLTTPMLALRSNEDAPAQFVFDRSQLGGPEGLLAFVVSASPRERDVLQAQVVRQAAALGWQIEPVQTVVERRATFACVPGLKRPRTRITPRLFACGDYVEGPYPATLEGAVRSAREAVAALS